MLEKVLELLEKLWTVCTPIAVCFPWQGGVIMRFARPHRVIKPGFHFKWPLVEDYVVTETAISTVRFPPQSLTTKDDKQVQISVAVRYRIADVEKFICDVWDAKDALIDTAMGAVGNCVKDSTYADLMWGNPERGILEEVRKGTKDYGYKIYAVTFGDRVKGRSLRLIMPLPKDLDN